MYSVIGWLSEVAYCSMIERKVVNRGFLMGPLCPVYGFGGLLVIFLLQPFSGNVFYLFTMAVIVTSTLEYVTGWALETIFATKWWDYSHHRFNIHGRVCLLNSLIFGGMSVVAVLFVHPAITHVLGRVPAGARTAIASAVAVLLSVDLVLTLRTLVDLRAKLVGFSEFVEKFADSLDIREWFNEHDLAGSLERIREKARLDSSSATQSLLARFERFARQSRGMNRLLKAFPALDRNIPKKKGPAMVDVLAGKKGLLIQFWVFLSASFIGVVLESVWCLATTGTLQSRTGLIYGMLNPVYGFGAVLMTSLLSRLEKKRDLVIFFASMVIGGAFEYLCSLAQEWAFGSVSWEYSGTQLNLHGRTNLMFSLMWGVLGLLWVRDAFPVLVHLVGRMRARAGKIVTAVLALVLLANCAVSSLAVHRWSERNRGVAAAHCIDRFFDNRYGDDLMRRIYPNMTFVEKKD
jgi:uncharacterized membrane protein